jgi:hypothetical protein
MTVLWSRSLRRSPDRQVKYRSTTYRAQAAHRSAQAIPQQRPREFAARQPWRRFARPVRAWLREQLLRSRDVPVSWSYASHGGIFGRRSSRPAVAVSRVGDDRTPIWHRWMLAATPSNHWVSMLRSVEQAPRKGRMRPSYPGVDGYTVGPRATGARECFGRLFRCFERWCPGEDSNLHELLHWYLKPARLPVPPPGQGVA